MSKFSPQLVERLQKHFAEKHNAQISEAKAQAYLDNLADLYLLVVGRAAGQARPQGSAPPLPPCYIHYSAHSTRKP